MEAGWESDQEILICTGQNFADSLSASATGFPILLVNNKTGKLTYEQQVFLYLSNSKKLTIIGGTGAVSSKLEQELASYGEVNRIYGNSRYETSVLIANNYFTNPSVVCIASGKNFPDGLCGGPLAFANNAPLILTSADKEAPAATYVEQTPTITSAYTLGGTGVLSESTVNAIFK